MARPRQLITLPFYRLPAFTQGLQTVQATINALNILGATTGGSFSRNPFTI